jgi:HlyD family secretion protein
MKSSASLSAILTFIPSRTACANLAGLRKLAVFAALMILTANHLGCGGARAGEAAFETARITRGDIEHRVIATGRIEPFSKVELRSKANGIVRTITVDEGDRVTKDQVVIELDRDILASRLNQARAALEKAQARYEQAQIEASTVELEAARKKYERIRKLYDQGLAPEQRIEDAETALETARQNYAARGAAVTMAKAELSAAKAAVEMAENELNYATIVSPVDGIVLRRDVDVGSAVASVASTMGTLLMTLGDTREMHMVGDVDESDIGLVREGMPARISVESYPDRKFKGIVRKLSPIGFEKDRIMNFEVEITIEDADVPLRTNMTADAEIIVEEHKNALLVAQNAIRYERKQSFVEVPDPQQTAGKRRVDVTLGISGTDFAEVLSGLQEDDEVILSHK